MKHSSIWKAGPATSPNARRAATGSKVEIAVLSTRTPWKRKPELRVTCTSRVRLDTLLRKDEAGLPQKKVGSSSEKSDARIVNMAATSATSMRS